MSLFKGLGMIVLGVAYKRTIGSKSYAKEKFKARSRDDQDKFFTRTKNKFSPLNTYGTCFKCEGSGKVTLTCKICSGSGTFSGSCRKCEGSGTFTIPERSCLSCQGHGLVHGRTCLKCAGSGVFLPARDVQCEKCDGRGNFFSSCKKCDAAGTFTVTCKKCDGSGWHNF
jgi:DnaJ-class molecular chaperone